MKKKQKNVSKFWIDQENLDEILAQMPDFFNYDDFDSLEKFKDTHPLVMQERIERQNWKLDLDISKKKFSFKDKLLYYFEKATGIRPFDFKNYKII